LANWALMKPAAYFRASDPTVSFAAGEVIFSEGDLGDAMYGVLDGTVELRHGDQVLERLGEQGAFGELALIDNSPRNLTAIAVEDTTLAVIDRRHFLYLVHETPMFALHIMSTLADRLRAVTRLTLHD
jgi:CRP/FNR family transcriptional regulator, cyclic AMP receptor protein